MILRTVVHVVYNLRMGTKEDNHCPKYLKGDNWKINSVGQRYPFMIWLTVLVLMVHDSKK